MSSVPGTQRTSRCCGSLRPSFGSQCLQARDDAIDKATKAQSSARKAVDDCKAQYDEQIFKFKDAREYCKLVLTRLDGARWQVADAKAKTCNTGTIPKAQLGR